MTERRRRRLVLSLLAGAFLSIGIWLAVGEAGSLSKLTSAIRNARPGWLLIALIGVPLGYLGYSFLYRALAGVAGGPRVDVNTALRLTVAFFGASVLATAAGRIGGEYLSFRRMGERPSQAWARVLAINTAVWAVLSALAFGGALALVAAHGARSTVEWGWLVGVPACVLPAVILSSPRYRRFTIERGGRVRRAVAAALRGLVLIRRTASRPSLLVETVLGGAAHWLGDLLTLWAALRAFGVSIGLSALIVGYATGNLATMLPLPAGGAGGVDAASTYALTLVGVSLETALLATVIVRLYLYWLPLLIAIVRSHSISRLPADLSAVEREGHDATARTGRSVELGTRP